MAGNENIFFKLLGVLIDFGADYSEIKKDNELRPKSKYFGTKSIVMSCLGMLLFPLTFVGVFKMINNDKNVFLIIFGILLVFVLLYEFLMFFIYNLMCFIAQLKLNKRKIGWIALALYFIMVIVSVVLLVLFL